MQSTADILKNYLDETRNSLIGSYRTKGLKASGSAEKLEVDVATKGYAVAGKIIGPLQWYFMQNGRRPNKKQTKGMIYFLSKKLDVWAEQKGITINTWMAAKKIVEHGITVPNPHNPGGVISDVINNRWMDELNKRLVSGTVDKIKTIMKNGSRI